MYLYSIHFNSIWMYPQIINKLFACVVFVILQKGNVFRASFRVNAYNRLEVGNKFSFFFHSFNSIIVRIVIAPHVNSRLSLIF